MRLSSLALALLFVVACSPAEPRRLNGGTAGGGGGGSSGAAGSGGVAGATGTAGSGGAGATGTAGAGDAGATGTAGSGGAGATGTAGAGDAGATGTAGGGGAGATGTAGGGGAGATGTAGSGGAGATGTAGNTDAGAADADAAPSGDADAAVTGGNGDTSSLDGNTADVPTTATIQINAGSTDAVPPFVVDTDFTGGMTIKHVNVINLSGVTNPAPQAVYQTARTGTATYTIPGFAAGSAHLVRLHFAETFWTMAGQRIFNVALNGTAVLTGFDIFATAGAANKAVIHEVIQPASAGGTFIIQLTSVTDKALISGIEIY